ncbi:MAG: hypothetical protein JNJ53_05430 [Rhizobiales bacterium]|nr:hypothetical protein [Hyphomicrobiales bacterium]
MMRDFLNRHFWIILAGLGCVLIAILSLVPGYLRPHTGAPGSFEHFAAYLMVAGAFAIGLRSERSVLVMVAMLMLAAGLFEIAQIDIPGRNPGLTGFVSSSLGAWAGLLVASVYQMLARRKAARG